MTSFDREKLERVAAFAEEAGSAQLAVIAGGEALIDVKFSEEAVDVAAVQKGLFAILIGIARDRGIVDLDDTMNKFLPRGWTRLGDAEERLTIRHLLTMTTGMDDALAPLGEIGQSWRYNNTAYNYLKRLLCEQTGMSLDDLTESWLTGPLGMKQTRWIDRPRNLPDGRPFTGLLMTAKDMVQLGRLVMNGGQFEGETIVSKEFIEMLAVPGSRENPSWGLMWHSNNQDHFRVPFREEKVYDGKIIPAAPFDLIAARGAWENHLGVVPSLDLIVARTVMMGKPGERPPRFERPFYELLMDAIT